MFDLGGRAVTVPECLVFQGLRSLGAVLDRTSGGAGSQGVDPGCNGAEEERRDEEGDRIAHFGGKRGPGCNGSYFDKQFSVLLLPGLKIRSSMTALFFFDRAHSPSRKTLV